MNEYAGSIGNTVDQNAVVLNLLQQILAELEAYNIAYAVIHGADDIATQLDSDVDIAVDRHPLTAFEPVFERLERAGQVRVIHRLHYEVPCGYYFVLALNELPGSYLHLDVLYDSVGSNHYLYTSEELLNGRHSTNGLWTTAPEKEATYLLIKKSMKAAIDDRTLTLVSKRIADAPERAKAEIERWFGPDGWSHASRLIEARDNGQRTAQLEALRTLLAVKLRFRGGLLGIRRWYQEALRRIKRIWQPSGLFVVVLGPDGSGKSTLVREALKTLDRAYRATTSFHWRPGLLPKPGRQEAAGSATQAAASNSPPDRPRYGYALSTLRFVYFLTDFVVGYWLRIYPARVRTTLVLGERWYYDVIINPERYGFKLPSAILQLGERLVPKPDLVLLLEAPAESIHQRKPELTVPQIREQLGGMHRILPPFPQGVVIPTGTSLNTSTRSVQTHILDMNAGRSAWFTVRRDRRTGWRGFPSGARPKVWIDNRDTPANALNLYHPYSRIGKTAKSVARRLPRTQTTSRCSPGSMNKLYRLAARIRSHLEDETLAVSFSTGTPGPDRKLTAQVSDRNRILAYVKIALSTQSRALIEKEARTLRELALRPIPGCAVPDVMSVLDLPEMRMLFLSAPSQPGRQRDMEFDSHDSQFLHALLPDKPETVPLDLITAHAVPDSSATNDNDVVVKQDALKTVRKLLGQQNVKIGPSHGDYAPWNTLKLNDGTLYVFDWEYATTSRPLLHDFFHRYFMPECLVKNAMPREFVGRMLDAAHRPETRLLVERTHLSQDAYLAYFILYLLSRSHAQSIQSGAPARFTIRCLRESLRHAGHPHYQPRVLVSAYACEPDKGSEPEVGWRWVQEIAREHRVWVITRSNNRPNIEAKLDTQPNQRLHFSYVDLPPWARFWKRGSRGIRLYYYLWQFAALKRARKLHKENDFDLAHQVTFVNDWLWTFLCLMPVPYIWGPIGSNAKSPPHLLPHRRARLIDCARIFIQNTVRWLDPLWWASALRARRIITINRQLASMLPLRWVGRGKVLTEPAVGITVDDGECGKRSEHGNVVILYVGRHLPIKGGALAIDAFGKALALRQNMRLVIIGEGPEEHDLRRRAARLGIGDYVDFLPWQSQGAVWQWMENADIFLFPSLEGAGMAILEAMRACLPVVSVDFGGPATIVSNDTGRLIPVGSRESVTDGLARALEELADDRVLRLGLGKQGRMRAHELFSWQAKGAMVRQLYRELLIAVPND